MRSTVYKAILSLDKTVMETILTSSVGATAKHTDTTLIYPYDLALDEKHIWVSVNARSLISKYTRSGQLVSSVTVTTPTGLALSKARDHCSRVLYIASKGGVVYAHNIDSSSTPTTFITVGGALNGIAWHKGKLYITSDNGMVLIYNGTSKVGQITDNALHTLGYRPFGIRALGKRIYVTYSNNNNIRPGFGYVNVISPKGCDSGCDSSTRLISRGNLSTPYGLALVNDELLVGNYGSGQISVFSLEGEYKHQISTDEHGVIVNDGIMGMIFCEESGRLYFVAANEAGAAGSLGYIALR